MTHVRLPYGCQSIAASDIASVVSALKGQLLTGGETVSAFEDKLAKYCGARYAISCSSGTAALHLATLALDLRTDDAVIVPAITFLATANCARYVGAEVVFADVDPKTGLVTAEAIEEAVVRARVSGLKPRAVLPVHYAGQVAVVGAVAHGHGLTIIEDAAHAIGSRYVLDDISGVVGDCRGSLMTIFSFHPVKTITTGEGGAILTNDETLAARLRALRNHGMSRDPRRFQLREQAASKSGSVHPWYYEMPEPGFNYRLTDIQAALGISQMTRLDDFVARRRAIVGLYDKLFEKLWPLGAPLGKVPNCCPGWHLYVLLVDFRNAGIDRATFMHELVVRGIGSQVHYLPVYRQPYYTNRYGSQWLAGAEEFYDRAISLPLFPSLSDEDVYEVANAVESVLLGKH